ncbi:fungal pheromone mating factor STE2 GPCR-domain-containing protein [Elsinoe ampelina]|uniref:Fungal pheromone mating factor STE2 GPCR-domain-containing protein n=1 Tax=Elsinoe ampelina TaxID=302913 RepID=A0A6A6G9J7_9PEZI|nr:fungal pheromone mating factor STE2 GPCR-domain-containing protein [Elsinoe ampelina]
MDVLDYTNPFDQIFIVHDRYGEEVEVPMQDVTSYVRNGIVQTIVLGSQIGAAIAVLIMLLILTKAEKRRLPVFWLNLFTLLSTVIANILLCLFYTTSWYSPYAYFTDDHSFVTTSAKVTSITAAIFQLLVLIGLETSLVLQVHVVSITFETWQRISVVILSTIVALIAIGFRIAQIVDNITYNILLMEYNYSSQWLIQARDIALATSICFFSLIFCSKLGHSLQQRKSMGMTQFGPMQIIFIGGAQTLIIPAVFAILQFLLPTTRINSLILTVTAISLPLTSLWASAVTSRPSKGTRGPDAHQKFLMSTPGGTFASGQSRKASGGHLGHLGEKGWEGMGTGTGTGTGTVEFERTWAVDGRERDLEMQDLERR